MDTITFDGAVVLEQETRLMTCINLDWTDTYRIEYVFHFS